MIWRETSSNGTAGPYFWKPETIMNGQKYGGIAVGQTEIHTDIHSCTIFIVSMSIWFSLLE